MSDKIAKLNNTSLCYQCGTCAAACKTGCIEMNCDTRKGLILPDVDSSKCTSCGLCEKVCPILNLQGPKDQFEALSTGIFYATDTTLFETSSSGGATGAILQYLFENDKIDCAVVTGITGIYAQPRIIRSSDEISQIQGSKYQPVALNTILSKIEKGARFAFVGLPCHINGLRRLAKYNKRLEEGLVIAIGIYCTIGRSMLSTFAALSKSKKTNGNLCYRYGDYPGNFGFIENNKFTHLSTFRYYLEQFDYLFYPEGCHYCDDLYNVHADISIGDTWGLGCGKSAIVMARTAIGEETVIDAEINGKLHKVRNASREENLATQEHSYRYKILNYHSRMKTLSLVTDSVLTSIMSINQKKARYSIPYFTFYLLSVFSSTSLGYRVVRNNFCRKFLLKIRNRLLRYVA